MSQNTSSPLIESDEGERYLSTAEMRHRYGNPSRMTINRWVKAGLIPAPVYIGLRPFWPLTKVVANEKTLPRKRAIKRAEEAEEA